MRLTLKATLILLVTIGVQYLIGGYASGGALDEAQFTMRAYVAHLAGVPNVDDGLLDAANSLRIRKEERAERLRPHDVHMVAHLTAMRVVIVEVG